METNRDSNDAYATCTNLVIAAHVVLHLAYPLRPDESSHFSCKRCNDSVRGQPVFFACQLQRAIRRRLRRASSRVNEVHVFVTGDVELQTGHIERRAIRRLWTQHEYAAITSPDADRAVATRLFEQRSELLPHFRIGELIHLVGRTRSMPSVVAVRISPASNDRSGARCCNAQVRK